MDVRDTIGRFIREKGVKQSIISAKAGMTEQQLSDVVRKRRKLEANEMFALCDALGINPNEIYLQSRA